MKQKRIIRDLIQYLSTFFENADVRISDAQALDSLTLPCIAVGVESLDAYAAALPNIHRAEILVTIRQHVGDDAPEPQELGDVAESALNDCSAAKAFVGGCDFWQYQGARESFDGAMVQTEHRISAVVR